MSIGQIDFSSSSSMVVNCKEKLFKKKMIHLFESKPLAINTSNLSILYIKGKPLLFLLIIAIYIFRT